MDTPLVKALQPFGVSIFTGMSNPAEQCGAVLCFCKRDETLKEAVTSLRTWLGSKAT